MISTRYWVLLKQKRRLLKSFLTILCAVLSLWMVKPAAETVLTAASAQRKLPIYCVDSKEKLVSITFDAAWGADDTDRLIEILSENNVKATFFVCGYWAERYSEEVKKLYNAGHEIANHGDSHAHVASLNFEQNKKEIMGAHAKVKELLGIDMNLYRPAFGEYNNTVLEAAEACGYYTVQWDVDSLDWKEYGVEAEIKQVLEHKHLGNGSILLFHNDSPYTPEALVSIIKGLKEKGFKIVPVSDLIYKENFYMDHEGRQKLNQ